MKRVIKSATSDATQYDKRYLLSIQDKMKALFDMLDEAPSEFSYKYGFDTLYDELGICIRQTDTQLNEWGI